MNEINTFSKRFIFSTSLFFEYEFFRDYIKITEIDEGISSVVRISIKDLEEGFYSYQNMVEIHVNEKGFIHLNLLFCTDGPELEKDDNLYYLDISGEEDLDDEEEIEVISFLEEDSFFEDFINNNDSQNDTASAELEKLKQENKLLSIELEKLSHNFVVLKKDSEEQIIALMDMMTGG